MQDNQNHIAPVSDELMAKYLSGKASQEEEQRVLDYIAQSDDNLEELTAVADAIQAQRLSEQHHMTSASANASHHLPRHVWSVAASVVLLVAVAAYLLWPRTTESSIQIDPAPMQADADTAVNSDSTAIQLTIHEE